jgi:hypothetical protein
MEEFYFDGRPRQIRVWDEGVLPARPLTLERFEFGSLLQYFRRGYDLAAAELDRVYMAMAVVSDNALLRIPDICELGVDPEDIVERAEGVNTDRMETLVGLSEKTVRVRNEFPSGKTVVSYEEFLPKDLAPMLILDASGGHRKTYEFWHQHRGGLEFLHSPQKQYLGLTIHHWNEGSGRTAHMTDKAYMLARGIAKTINAEVPPDAEVLVIHFKPDKPRKPRRGVVPKPKGAIPDMEAEIKSLITGNGNRVKCCNWGRHTATNAYCKIRYVFLAVILQYNLSQYDATLRLSKGMKVEEEYSDEEYRDIRLGEIANNILQAANRGAIRNSIGGGCPPDCHLYVVFPTNDKSGIPLGLLEQVFPGAVIDDSWLPEVDLKGNKKKLANYIVQEAMRGMRVISRAALGIGDQSYLKRLLEDREVRVWLKDRGIALEISRQAVRLTVDPAKMPERAIDLTKPVGD